MPGERVTVPTLVMTGGALDGTAYRIPMTGREVAMGSSMDAGVQIMLGNVEPFHAKLIFTQTGLAIADAGSATGTFVNGEKVDGEHAAAGGRSRLPRPSRRQGQRQAAGVPAGGRRVADARDGDALAPGHGIRAVLPRRGPGARVRRRGSREPAAFDLGAAAEAGYAGEEPLFASPLPPAAPPEPMRPAPPPPTRAPSARVPAGAAARSTSPSAAARAARARARAGAAGVPQRHAVDPGRTRGRARGVPVAAARGAPGCQAGGRQGQRQEAKPKGPSFTMPSIPVVPILGGAAALALVGALVWFFVLRKTPPELAAVTPTTVDAGEAVTLAGKNFGKDAASNSVFFGPTKAQITEASPTSLRVVVPQGLKAQVAVVVETSQGRSKAISITLRTEATTTGVSPDVVMSGQTVLVRGEGLQGQNLSALVAGVTAPTVEAVAEGARVTIPALPLPEGSKTQLVLNAAAARRERSTSTWGGCRSCSRCSPGGARSATSSCSAGAASCRSRCRTR